LEKFVKSSFCANSLALDADAPDTPSASGSLSPALITSTKSKL